MARRAEPSDRRLATYRAKRDFAVTSEPAGSGAPRGGRRFVVQRHRASRLHYDFRLELDGVLVSWAVPKGPPLDPKARHLAVHVEDHPVEYFDFEGVIPAGEYGGGDVIVWDWGTWEAADDEPAAAIEAGDLHFDLHGERLKGRFVLTRSRRKSSGKDQWLMLHKADEFARPGWSAEAEPRSVKSGRTNEEVAAAPETMWRSDLPAEFAALQIGSGSWNGPSADELAALDALDGKGLWSLGGHELKVTNLDKALFPPRDDDEPITKRELIRCYAELSPFMLPYLADRALNTNRFPGGVQRPGFWQKEVPTHAPRWLNRWHNEAADPDETQWYVVADHPATLAWLANYGAIELHPWTSALHDPQQPTWALIDIDPGTATDFDDVLQLARLYRTALDHLSVAAMPKVTGQRGIQIWVPVRPGYTFTETRSWVEKVSRAVGQTVPELVSWEWHKERRSGLARLDYTQNAINKTLVAPFSARPAPGAPVSVPIHWEELDDPDLRPDRWTLRTVLAKLRADGDPLAPLIGTHQDLPRV